MGARVRSAGQKSAEWAVMPAVRAVARAVVGRRVQAGGWVEAEAAVGRETGWALLGVGWLAHCDVGNASVCATIKDNHIVCANDQH